MTALFLCSFMSLQAQPGYVTPTTTSLVAPTGPTTTIEFAETTFDFGEVQSGDMIVHVFTFTNTGEEPLILSDAKGSCGCTVPQWPREPIAPGETASITVEFNSKNKAGKRNQKVTLTTNTNPPQSFVYLTGTVIKDEDAEEPSFGFEEEVETVEENPNCFIVYPNPTAERLILDMKDNLGETAMITILSQNGQLMAQREVKGLNDKVEFQVGHFPAGTYYANVEIEGRKPESRCFVVVDR